MLKQDLNHSFYHWPKTWANFWEAKSLSQQFALMSSVVLLGGMVAIGAWVAEEIETSVTVNTAVNTALYIDSFVAPHAQELATQNWLSEDRQASLDELLHSTAIGSRIASFKLWKPGGLIAYSSRKSIIGQVFPETDHLKRAWAGSISAEFDTLVDEEDAEELADGVPYLEMYSPVHEELTGRIIAVAEFYEKANLFQQVLFRAKLKSWLLVLFVTMVMLSLLFVIVRRGSQTIEIQESALKERIRQLSDLRNRLKTTSRRSTELNEQFLRRVGADLHDGPAQLLGLALLRLASIRQLIKSAPQIPGSKSDDLDIVQNALSDALTEIRDISAGLVLPELDALTPNEILTKAVSSHENRTHTSVSLNQVALPKRIRKSIQICLYRLVQEGLNNAERHAPGAACSINASYSGNTFEVEVSDAGSGFDPKMVATSSSGLGLPGLRDRIESVGGHFEIHSTNGQGTRLIARFSIADFEETPNTA
jgi:signal transduction histidine kinase